MSSAWQMYDELIEAIPSNIEVKAAVAGLRWCQVISSVGGFGMAYSLPDRSRPPLFNEPTFIGQSLRNIAKLSKSWNFAEASIGIAALNAWYSHPDQVTKNGFTAVEENPWNRAFARHAECVRDQTVSVVGHFPFVPSLFDEAKQVHMLERSAKPGDYPDPACEYLLAESDIVFIFASAFINKTMPRLLELAKDAYTIVVGPSAVLSPTLFERGVDEMTGFVAKDPEKVLDSLGGLTLEGMFQYGYRVSRTFKAFEPYQSSAKRQDAVLV